MQAKEIDPHDATVFSNLSLCLLRMKEGEQALKYARQCKALRPDWFKAWYREGMALSLLKVIANITLNSALQWTYLVSAPAMILLYCNLDPQNYKGAVDALDQALKLEPANNEIKEALR
jgi:tetratricopeptide (TPR) repeat protein